MTKQKYFSLHALHLLKEAFWANNGESYLNEKPFAVDAFEELESPDIDAAPELASRIAGKPDVEVAIALYEAFPHLNRLEASDPGFWTHLTHIELWNYMRERFPLSELSVEKRRTKIEDKWFLGDPSQSALIHHPLAGLWWGVLLTVAPERGEEKKYDLTHILFRNLDLPTRTLGTYELGRLPAAVKGVLGYVFDHPDLFKENYEAKMRAIMRLLNAIGGVVQLGCMDEAFFRLRIEENRDTWLSARKKQS